MKITYRSLAVLAVFMFIFSACNNKAASAPANILDPRTYGDVELEYTLYKECPKTELFNVGGMKVVVINDKQYPCPATTTSTEDAPRTNSTQNPTAVHPLQTSTPAPQDFIGIIFDGCPSPIVMTHPDTGVRLICDEPGYPGDVDVRYHAVIYSGSQDIKLVVQPGAAVIASWWKHGWNYDPKTGALLDVCPEGKESDPTCEGTFVLTGTAIVPKGYIVDLNYYFVEAKAHNRFNYYSPIGMANFACEYVANDVTAVDGHTIVHSENNIVVATWAIGIGTVYEFDITLPNPMHCPGYSTPQ